MQTTKVGSLQCSTIWLPNCTTKRLQHIQTATAYLIKLTRKHDHVSPIPFNLHWLPVMFMIFFGIIIHAQYAYALHFYNYINYPTTFFFSLLCYLKVYVYKGQRTERGPRAKDDRDREKDIVLLHPSMTIPPTQY